MSEGMWFWFGVLCGVLGCLGVGLCRRAKAADVEKSGASSVTPTDKTWVHTRNFLYYDGTVMPEIKEDLNEQ